MPVNNRIGWKNRLISTHDISTLMMKYLNTVHKTRQDKTRQEKKDKKCASIADFHKMFAYIYMHVISDVSCFSLYSFYEC